MCINHELYINTYISLIDHSKMQSTDNEFSIFKIVHLEIENNETYQGECLTANGYS